MRSPLACLSTAAAPLALAIVGLVGLPSVTFADSEWAPSAPLLEVPRAVGVRAAMPPPLKALGKALGTPLALLPRASEAAAPELERMALWNRAGLKPARNGLSRALPAPQEVSLGSALGSRSAGPHAGGLLEKAADGALVWGTSVTVAGAHRLRFHLQDVRLPDGALLWVWSDQETVGPFGLELRDEEGGLWTPSVGGETARLEIKLPAAGLAVGVENGFVIDQMLEIVGPEASSLADLGLLDKGGAGQCLVNAQCVNSSTFDVIDLAQRAMAHLEFVDSCPQGIPGNCGYVCSGGLLNDTVDDETPIPYLLTANHCFSRQRSAATLEAFFDYFSATCTSPAPNLNTLPRSNGSTIMASGASSDYTLVRLNSIPASRVLLAWTSAPVTNNQVLHRISSPCDPNVSNTCSVLPQLYSRNHVNTAAPTCQGAARPDFIYETYFPGQGDRGGTFGGSSGAPVMLDGARVVGQLTGGCGLNPNDGCDYDNAEVDGAFSRSFTTLAKFLDPRATTCVPSSNTMCLVGGRFQVTMEYRNQQGGEGRAQVSTSGTDNSGLFYFTNPSNWEMLIKVLNGCAVNNRQWVFYAATTNVDFTLTVVDTSNGSFQVYSNNLGTAAAPVQDTNAFTCP